ncbi:queuosine precursor transporter [Candidatus Woesearchaeota archaeon]|jgi:queuosine precursor transporter|nr:queuosine precursor transporter [Candidatus Woesearchaeota archaeon]
MTSIILIIIWMLATLVLTSFAGILSKKFGVEFLIGTMAAMAVIANVLAAKIVQFGPFTVAGGIIAFSVTFLVTDIISEKWGKKEARKAVWCGLFANVLFVVSIFIAISWDSAPFAMELGNMFNSVLGLTPRIAIASMIAYTISQSHDVWAFHFWKKLTKGKHMWVRNNASTVVSQAIDTALFTMLAFYGVFPNNQLSFIILGGWLAKVVVAILDTPFMYLVIWIMDCIPSKKYGIQKRI